MHHAHDIVQNFSIVKQFLHPVEAFKIPLTPFLSIELEKFTPFPEHFSPRRFASPFPELRGTIMLVITIRF